jgi:ABC-2 type transport system permease protein
MSTTRIGPPFLELVKSRLREFLREPEAIFWVYGFPLLMTLVLGIAFREKPIEQFTIDVEEGPRADWIEQHLQAQQGRFKVSRGDFATGKNRLRKGQTSLIVRSGESTAAAIVYWYDPYRPESSLAQRAVDDVLQRAAGRTDPLKTAGDEFSEPGGRYIDFLVPGLLGMSIMGGGLWGVGFVIVDMRIRKLLKRFLATPMRRPDFLLAVMTSRFAFMLPEVVILLIFAYLVFHVVIQGNVLLVILFVVLGGLTFSGLGLLVASRAKTLETVSGLMNLVMLPMWVLSGIFFSAERYPEVVQPVIKALPLTLLIDGLRAVMNEGAGFWEVKWYMVGLLVWGVACFVAGLRIFRWQ